ncbi:type IV secretory system conjugative DNA transfer family protein [Nocardiopsis sp. NRRL B-16309]|uniref:type IV secretory system conjugative DNA transfer family protein n=1 Tax=Nocardiopsis sp. NRRL B-16309 TaxID=1519494 RepID=UPI0006AFDB2C|nr:type IV secretory system conjugative DNA transfer family protein [Nocardiopsis sp. NRRL B-16309]KOX14021.1 ATPase [Nocardiopsis sp. NRRL B-16309]
MARRGSSPKASAWDKLSSRGAEETLANRDIYESQQLDRSRIERKRTRTARTMIAIVAGVLVAVLVWALWSVGQFTVSAVASSLGGPTVPDFVEREQMSSTQYCYRVLDEDGEAAPDQPCHETEDEALADPPQWVLDDVAAQQAQIHAESEGEPDALPGWFLHLTLVKLAVSLGAGLITFGVAYLLLMRNRDAQNLLHDTSDINQYQGDQHIALPDEVVRKFDWFPDVGAHSSVQPSSMISHVMVARKGLKSIEVAKRADEDVLDSDGDVEFLKGEILRDDDDRAITAKTPLIDEKFGEDLFEASGLPKDKKIRKRFDTTRIPYNPDGKDRGKLGEHKTVADMINADWEFPEYEVQRPAGAYIVDTAPVNTMVLAITRAGKGQTYIEPMIDMWLREKSPNNMVINDPKGELLVKHYVRATMRGFQVVQFNLINAMKTDIYNPLGMAAEAAREGDSTKCAMYIENIADVFFPLDGGEDPVWPNAASNAFKRAAYGLIDFYLEEERELRAYAARVDMDPKVLETKLDEKWGKVTLYNCYQLFVQLSAKKVKNPVDLVEESVRRGDYGSLEDGTFREAEAEAALVEAENKAFLWEDKKELDMLTLFFNATNGLPTNSMRTLVGNADNALRAMGAAEKMLASVYGIAITAMSFFADPTISTLTSGTPSQNTDLGGLSFPRRMGVRFAMNYLKRDHLIGAQAKWDAYADERFEQALGKDFEHEDIVSREGWARYYFKGKFAADVAYVRLRLLNPQTGMLIRTFHFKFKKDYQTSLNGRFYVTDPVTGEKIIRNGILLELRKQGDGSFAPGNTTYPQMRLTNVTGDLPQKEMGQANAITQTMVRYSEQPKVVFLVTPPHLMKYAKLILILIKQLVDLNFDKSYMTKENQKPLYKTRFMLDELGNLQSEGHGISGFETMLSIGLGQEQQFTLILQTLQQLRDVYGESVDKIVQGNTSNIVFLKSTDDSMLDTLEKMSGKRHTTYMDSKTVTQDKGHVVKGLSVEGKVSYTMSTKEEPVISYNDMAFISERNSIVFRAGDSPVWNRNETILPMSWRMFEDTINHPGHDYTLQTIPTLSNAVDFDVRMNQPDFEAMLAKRMQQAQLTTECREKHKKVHGLSEVDVARLDPDTYANEVMELVDAARGEAYAEEHDLGGSDDVDLEDLDQAIDLDMPWEFDTATQQAVDSQQARMTEFRRLRYANNLISRDMLVHFSSDPARPHAGALDSPLDAQIIEAYKSVRPALERDGAHFSVSPDGALRSADGSRVYISRQDESEAMRRLQQASESETERVFAEDPEHLTDLHGFQVHGAFYEFLAERENWLDLARGEFDRAMADTMRDDS